MKNQTLIFGMLGILMLFVLPLVQLAAVSGQEVPGVPSHLTPEKLLEQQQRIEQYRNITEWQMLGVRFREAMLKNPVISGIDWFFTQISFIFRILFGMPYSLSVTLLCVIALWFIVFLDFGKLLANFSTFSSYTSYSFSALFAVVLAQVRVFEIIVNFFGTLIFSRESKLVRFVLFLFIIGLIVLFHYLSRLLAKHFGESKEAKKKREVEVAGEEIKARARGFKKGMESEEKNP